MAAVMSAPSRPHLALTHKPADVFHPGSDLIVSLDTTSEVAAILRYRHVDQAERWTSIPMSRTKRGFEAAIPASYTASPYPLQYYFELRKGTQHWSHPGFNANLSNTPYYVVFKRV